MALNWKARAGRGPRVGIISMGEAGNLGDDLILVFLIDAIYGSSPQARVRFLSHGVPLDWPAVARALDWPRFPVAVAGRRELPRLGSASRFFRKEDLVLFGGGGLLQCSHGVHDPYRWLSYVPEGRVRPPIIGVGLGAGPFNEHWIATLREKGSPFDLTHVRDSDSVDLLERELGWNGVIPGQDFVVAGPLSRLLGIPSLRDIQRCTGRLGIALRPWPGIKVADVIQTIRTVAADFAAQQLVFYVLEDKPRDHTDRLFAERVAEELRHPRTTVTAYHPGQVREFVLDMLRCEAGVATKLHAGILWGLRDTPVWPICYAPKVSAFFGVPHLAPNIGASYSRLAEPLGLSAREFVQQQLAKDASSRCNQQRYFRRTERLTYRCERIRAAIAGRLQMVDWPS